MPNKPLLLLIDDDHNFSAKLSALLADNFDLEYLPNLDNFTEKFKAIEFERRRKIDIILLDLNFTKEKKLEGLDFPNTPEGKAIIDRNIQIIIVTNYKPTEAVVQLIPYFPARKWLFKSTFSCGWILKIQEVIDQLPIRLYLNYAEADTDDVKLFRTQVINNLKNIYKDKFLIIDKTPEDILGGDNHLAELEKYQQSSNFILHLLTSNLLAVEDPLRNVEKIWEQTPHAINIPVLLKKCLWEDLPILKGKDIVPIPKSKKFLFSNNRNRCIEATKELQKLLDQMK